MGSKTIMQISPVQLNFLTLKKMSKTVPDGKSTTIEKILQTKGKKTFSFKYFGKNNVKPLLRGQKP